MIKCRKIFIRFLSRCALGVVLAVLSSVVSAKPDSHWQENFGVYFQDLKNYLAIKDLEKTKGKLAWELESPPNNEAVMNSVSQGLSALNLTHGVTQIIDNELVKYHLYMKEGVGDDTSFVIDHLKTFCTGQEFSLGLCKQKKFDQPYDLMGSSLLAKTSMTKLDRDIALRFIRNLINPVPLALIDDLTSSKGVLTDKGIKHLAAKYKMAPGLTLAQISFEEMLASRVSMDDDAAKSGASKGGSLLQMIQTEAYRRFFDQGWYGDMTTKSGPTVLREIANIMALQVVIDYRGNRHLERIEAILAAQLAQTSALIAQGQKAQEVGDNVANDAIGGR